MKNKMAKNHMEQVAQMLGVELEEEFKIEGSNYKYRLTEKSVQFYDEFYPQWKICSYRIMGLLNGDYKIIKIPKPILDEAEKEYLSNVIKPFRNRVKYIAKYEDCGKELIYINLEYEEISLPYFEPKAMYKGMELDKEYTLEELGL